MSQQVNAALTQSYQPLVAWRLEWVSGELDQLWPDSVSQISNEHHLAYVTGYAHDDSDILVYLVLTGKRRCWSRSGPPARLDSAGNLSYKIHLSIIYPLGLHNTFFEAHRFLMFSPAPLLSTGLLIYLLLPGTRKMLAGWNAVSDL